VRLLLRRAAADPRVRKAAAETAASAVREARDIFREALIQDEISPDLEEELRRLVRVINEMLNQRAVP